jgi:trehalose 6-phosphate synthase
MGDYDVLGFQTEIDADNFRAYLTREGIGRVRRDGRVTIGGRRVTIGVYPIGIDVETFREMAYSADAVRQAQRLRRSVLGGHLIIGVDRLDYSKGIDERLRAFRSLLSNYPQYHGKVTYVQISAPSREEVKEYIEIRRQVEQTAGRINGRYSQLDWVPLRYINRSFSRRALAGFYRVARIGLVTPLRDGMNLVAKEYAAAHIDGDGVLVLSEFAGAADELTDAVLVNPHDHHALQEAIVRAVEMHRHERRGRMAGLRDQIRKSDVQGWADRFMSALTGSRTGG